MKAKLGNIGTEMQGAASAFVEPLLAELADLGLHEAMAEIDHVCYRVADIGRYESLKQGLLGIGTLISEAQVNGRPIACYKLARPILLSNQHSIRIFELPAPRTAVVEIEGFEHIEVVVRMDLGSFLEKFKTLPFDTKNMGAAVNRDASLRLQGGIVKFHERSLEEIISEEKLSLVQENRKLETLV